VFKGSEKQVAATEHSTRCS